MDYTPGHLAAAPDKSRRIWATIFIVIMSIQFIMLEGHDISPLKVIVMAISPFVFIAKVRYVYKAFVWGIAYWVCCFLCALLNSDVRFSTLGYLGLFVAIYVTFSGLINERAFTLSYFKKLLRFLIFAFSVWLILQQVCLLVGIRSFSPLNIVNQPWLALTKLPSLTLEPSHSARILTAIMLCYLRCLQLENGGHRATISQLFSKNNYKVTTLFLWTMLTMGSGTAFIGLGILSLYFITRKSAVYMVPLLCVVLYIGQKLEIEQLQRAISVSESVVSEGSPENVAATDQSAATRIIPLINTFTKTDLTSYESWFGKGTSDYDKYWWTRTDLKISIVEQYGLLSFIISLLFVYKCMIRKLWSLESLIFLIFIGCTLSNVYYVWGIMMFFTCTKYFYTQADTERSLSA